MPTIRKTKSKICKGCGKEFEPRTSLQKVCTWKCLKLYEDNKRKEKTKRIESIYEDEKLRKKADRLLQKKYTFGFCEVCGLTRAHCCHHVVYKSRSNYLRYNPENLVRICNSCHDLHHRTGDPKILGTIIKKRGIEWYTKLEQQRDIHQKLTVEHLRQIIKELEDINELN